MSSKAIYTRLWCNESRWKKERNECEDRSLYRKEKENPSRAGACECEKGRVGGLSAGKVEIQVELSQILSPVSEPSTNPWHGYTLSIVSTNAKDASNVISTRDFDLTFC